MTRFQTLLAAAVAAFALPALAGEAPTVSDAYALSATPTAKTGAVFLTLTNPGPEDDRLIAARTDAAERAELHTHVADASGVMRMREIEDGIPLPAGTTHTLARGGDHVMLLGLTAPLIDGETLTLTLVFEVAGEVTVEVPVDLDRPADGGHGAMGHGMSDG